MFSLRKYPLIDPELSKYIKESTNKSIEKYLNKSKILCTPNENNPNNIFLILPFVSLVSFLAGYHFCKIKTITHN